MWDASREATGKASFFRGGPDIWNTTASGTSELAKSAMDQRLGPAVQWCAALTQVSIVVWADNILVLSVDWSDASEGALDIGRALAAIG